MLPRAIEVRRLLRWGLYLVLGLMLAQMMWVIASQSLARGRYFPIAFLSVLVAVAVVIGYLERKCRGERFHFYHPWRIPDLTTRGILWLIAGLDAVMTAMILVIVMVSMALILSRVDTAFILPLAGVLGVSFVPYEYWTKRRLYEPVPVGETAGDPRALLRYMGYSQVPLRGRLLLGLLTGASTLILMLWLRWLID